MNSPLERRSFTEIFNNENNAPKKKADITELIYTNLGTFQSFFPKKSKNMRKFSSRRNSKTFHIFGRKFGTYLLLFWLCTLAGTVVAPSCG